MTLTTEAATEPLFRLARHTPFNIAPERGAELGGRIFGAGGWTISPSHTEANFWAVPPDKAVFLPYAGLASLWSLAFAGFHLIDAASRRQRLPRTPGQTYINCGDVWAQQRLGDYVAYARALFHADAPWPAGLATPQADAPLNSVDGRVNNLFFGALSWIILHEIGHVHHDHIKLAPADVRVRQEYEADGFATRWILAQAGSGRRREFRVLMISVALTWLFLNELEKGRSSTHPAAILRFREAVEKFGMGRRSAGLENAAYLFKAVLDPATLSPPFETPRGYFKWVRDRLETLFPS